MQRPKWLTEWKTKKNMLEGYLTVDLTEIKVVEGTFDQKLFFISVGTMPKADAIYSEKKALKDAVKKDLEWKIFYDSTILPTFLSIEKIKDLMDGIVAFSSGSSSVCSTTTSYIPVGNRPSKGNAPLLLNYDLVKKIHESKSQKID